MKAKRFLSILLAVLMLVAVFAACGGKDDGQSSSKAPESSKDEGSKDEGSKVESSDVGEDTGDAPEVTIMMDGDNTPNATNMVLDKLGERTNTKINMIYTPTDDAATKRSTMAASDTLPDLFRVQGVVTEAQEYVDAGLIYNLAGLEDKAPNWFGNAGDLISQVPANQDGAIYYVPSGQLGYAYNLNIRTDWLENLGMKMPTNLDELYDVYDAFTNRMETAKKIPLAWPPTRIPGPLILSSAHTEFRPTRTILCWKTAQSPSIPSTRITWKPSNTSAG